VGYTTKTHIVKYRVTVEELVHYRTDPSPSDPEGTQKEHNEVWESQDVFTTGDKETFAGALESIAKRYKPEQKVLR
jgi:cytochrome c556